MSKKWQSVLIDDKIHEEIKNLDITINNKKLWFIKDKVWYLLFFYKKHLENDKNSSIYLDEKTLNKLLDLNISIQWVDLNKKEDISRIINHLIWSYESK